MKKSVLEGNGGVVDYGSALRRIRKAQNLSLPTLGRKTGLPFEYIGKIERGEVDSPGIRNLVTICRALGITLNDLSMEAGDVQLLHPQSTADELTESRERSKDRPMPLFKRIRSLKEYDAAFLHVLEWALDREPSDIPETIERFETFYGQRKVYEPVQYIDLNARLSVEDLHDEANRIAAIIESTAQVAQGEDLMIAMRLRMGTDGHATSKHNTADMLDRITTLPESPLSWPSADFHRAAAIDETAAALPPPDVHPPAWALSLIQEVRDLKAEVQALREDRS